MTVQAATVGDIVRYKDAPTRKPLQSAIALTVVFWVLLFGGEAALPWSQGSDDHAPHAVATSVSGEFADMMDHPHVQQSAVLSPDTFAAAVVPRVTTILVALGLAVAVAAAWMYGGHGIWATLVRGPPRGRGPVASGRQLLARLCISRR